MLESDTGRPVEVDIEEECLKILALHQPVAVDLRYIIAVLKINQDLERIGDEAVNIAERFPAHFTPDAARIGGRLSPLCRRVQEALRNCLDALVRLDAPLAHRVRGSDNEIDEMVHVQFVQLKDEINKALSEQVKWNGYRLVIADGHAVARTRMYTSLPEMWEGWTKNIYLGLSDTPSMLLLGAFGATLALLAALFLPAWPLLGFVWFQNGGGLPALGVIAQALMLWAVLLLARVAVCRGMGISRWYAFTVPLGAGVFASIMLASAWKVLSGQGVTWRGRLYRSKGSEFKGEKMKKLLISIPLLTLLLAACTPRALELEASDVWARTAMIGGNGAVYLTLTNGTAADDELLSASSGIAETIEIHLSQLGTQGEMKMIRQEKVPLTAGGKVEFKPGGLHIMLINLRQDLLVGDQFQLTLHFRDHADIILDVIVKEGGMDM